MTNETEIQLKTKKCPHCQSEIPIKAKKCPQCQSDLRNWFNRHPILTVLGVFIVFIIAISIIGSGAKKEGYISTAPIKVGEAPIEEIKKEEAKTPQVQIYSVGDKVKLGSAIITVNKVEFSQGGAFTKPAEGNEWVNLNITIENTGSSNQWVTTLGQMFIRDSENNSYQIAVTDKILENPTFGLDGTILPKSKRTGWVGFEIKKDISGLKFQYNGSIWGGGTVVIDLGR